MEYCKGLMISSDDGDVRRNNQMEILKAVLLIPWFFLRVGRQEVTSRLTNGRVHKACDDYRTIVSSRNHSWNSFPSWVCSVFWNAFDVHPVLSVLSLARFYEVVFDLKSFLWWYPNDFANSVAMRVPEYNDLS